MDKVFSALIDILGHSNFTLVGEYPNLTVMVGDSAERQPLSNFGIVDVGALPDAPTPVPQVVSRAQGKMVLVQAGLWSAVEAAVAQLDGEAAVMASIALNDTTEWRRDSPFLAQMADMVGISDRLDELFIAASQIQI